MVYDELKSAGQWVKKNPKPAAALLAPVWGLDVETVELANSRRSYEIGGVTESALAEQQRIADTFLNEGLLPTKVSSSDIGVWKP